MAKYIVEFIGTFFLIFTIGAVVVEPEIDFYAPVAIGSVLTALVYAGGYISGAHYNPAVTICLWLRGTCKILDVPLYIIFQLLASVAATYSVLFVKGFPAIVSMDIPIYESLLVEFLFTFALCFVILGVATAKSTKGNSYYGLAIGFVVMAGVFTVGDISGAVFNPAVAAGLTLMKILSVSNIWIYIVASFIAGILAAGIFALLKLDER
ncbi:MAG: porin [Candidatus Dadabacteria bacterium]|nr:porin [Candidatus Dadabacteria bacterium]